MSRTTCTHCGAALTTETVCPYCDCAVERPDAAAQYRQPPHMSAAYDAPPRTEQKSMGITLVLCLTLGWLGMHRFYTGNILLGILYLFTSGLCGIGILVDFILILTRSYRDGSKNPLK